MFNIITKSIKSYIECYNCGYNDTGRYYLDAIISLHIDCQIDNKVTDSEKQTIEKFADLAAQLRADQNNNELFHNLIVALGHEY